MFGSILPLESVPVFKESAEPQILSTMQDLISVLRLDKCQRSQQCFAGNRFSGWKRDNRVLGLVHIVHARVWRYRRTVANLQFRLRREDLARSVAIVFREEDAMRHTVPHIYFDRFEEGFLNTNLIWARRYKQPRAILGDYGLGSQQGSFSRLGEDLGLLSHLNSLMVGGPSLSFNGFKGLIGNSNSQETGDDQESIKSPQHPVSPIPMYRHGGKFADSYGLLCIFGAWGGTWVLLWLGCDRIDSGRRLSGWSLIVGGILLDTLACTTGAIGCLPWDWWKCLHDDQNHSDIEQLHYDNTVPQKCSLTTSNYWGTVIVVRATNMANVLPMEKRVAVISALAEGSGIRQIERMTGINRNTIMNLGVRVGQGCASLMDHKMRNLPCEHLQFDELWGFIGKKQKHVQPDDNPDCGDVWTFCAIDSDTKLVPSFKVGKRTLETANLFVGDVASRMANRIQISTDGLPGYVEAVERAFGMNVDYAQIVKVYESEAADAEVIRVDKRTFAGRPDLRAATTSHVERLNGTTRLHMRRLTRLTYAFSKKKENFEAAVALHFAYYNFVKRHNTLRMTPAMAAGIERDFWTVGNLVEATV